jgi:hypothetical protein
MIINGFRVTGKWTIECPNCGGNTTLKYARAHDNQCKQCAEPALRKPNARASRETQRARYIDCGPLNWDDR